MKLDFGASVKAGAVGDGQAPHRNSTLTSAMMSPVPFAAIQDVVFNDDEGRSGVTRAADTVKRSSSSTLPSTTSAAMYTGVSPSPSKGITTDERLR